MPKVSDNFHNKKLNELGINIKTTYIADNKFLIRNTNNSRNDDVLNGVRFLKEYYLKDELIHTEKVFDTRIEYTFISNSQDEEEMNCINCGARLKKSDFNDGCPYCGTNYNIDYLDKNLGSKYHYDKVLRSNTYRIITFIIDLIVSMFLSYLFILNTSRTFNNYDISKIFIYGFILALILYYFFYLLDAYIILGPIKRYKDKQNNQQIDFWNRTKIDKKVFFNNLNYEVRKYYYTKTNIIDYDVIDYLSFNEFNDNNNLCVEVIADVRVVYYENNKIKSKYIKDKYILRRHDNGVVELHNGINMIRCHNCGSTIDVTKGKCDYCDTKIKYLQEWILDKE